ncbi:ABC transporter substrate-binding protein [Bradyrhizobium sacchari]|uniref:Amino acid ABC transporter substrate-binding protein (PAAT family) n=1 Tax=Bradyrhizobium sacchari TaxID=1399419 RepID=A0A560JWX4_9BRAD|nr:transporter substrate-binding domain-containing protein [Bradyrhizobium sacchari]OPZ00104.1 ABC transporter substrate-binding protein [Bradyrhizobium sacchari]TWB60126.1 amino acid ABC transporter substrate-binding protein (PAAT family) [Bradyrhizobium sacchari]TWB74064.1 amino acid ABC transporter substrate-binding protein (PAAT family) [Bradyrhizobium sacchari]
MNRRDALTTVALAGAAMAATASVKADTAPTSTLERIKKSGVLRVAVIAGQDPYFHKDLATNQWSGACIDMANDIAGKLGAKVETLESTWGNQILDLQAEKIDLAFAVNPTPERSLVIDFSTPILVHSFTVITKKGFAKPQTWAELNKPEVKIAVDIGSTHETIARRYCPKANILGFKERNEAILAVATGRADCNISLAVLSVATLKKNPTLGELAVPRPLLTLPTNMGIRAEADRRYKDFLSAWADYNRSLGQTREWMLKGFEAVGLGADDIPGEVQF